MGGIPSHCWKVVPSKREFLKHTSCRCIEGIARSSNSLAVDGEQIALRGWLFGYVEFTSS